MSTDVSDDSRTQSLVASFAVQSRVLRALLLREVITRFGRRNLGVLWLVAEPALFTMMVASFWAAAGLHQASNLPIIAFAVTGYSSVLLWRNTVGHCTNAIMQNVNLLYHQNVRAIDVFLARILLEIGGATASFITLVSFLAFIEVIEWPRDPLTVVAGWSLLAWFGAALGLTVGAATTFSELVQRLWHPISYMLFPLSGAAFLVTALPPQAQELVLILPMVHGVEMMRDGYFGDVIRTRYDGNYIATINLVLTFSGLLLVKLASRRTEAK